MKFLSLRRFNYIDTTGILWAVSLANKEQYAAAIGVVAFALVLSVTAETIWGEALKKPEEVSYLLRRGYSRRFLDVLDDRISLHARLNNCFMAGYYAGRLHMHEEREWWQGGCKGPEPKLLRSSDYYLSRHLLRQYKRIARFVK